MKNEAFREEIAKRNPGYSADFVLCVEDLADDIDVEDAEAICEIWYG